MSKKDSPRKAFNRFLKKRYSKAIQQRIVLLLEREKDRISKFRAEWHIPEDGFKNQQAGKQWSSNLAKIAPDKVKDVGYVEFETFYMPEKLVAKTTVLSEDMEEFPRITTISKNPHAVFDQEIKQLLKDLKLDQELHAAIRDYICFGKASVKAITNNGVMVSERTIYSLEYGEIERTISLTFNANSDEQDIRDTYKHVAKSLQQDILGNLQRKPKPQKEFERNRQIMQLHCAGKTIKEIATILSDENINIDEEYIHKIIKRIRAY